MSRRAIALGIGCDRGTSTTTIREAIAAALVLAGAGWSDVAAVASITLKANEAGLLAVAAEEAWSLRFFTPQELSVVAVPNPSETVRRHTGTPSVSEAAALLAAGTGTSMQALLVEKHKHLGTDGRNATVSIARMNT